MTKKLVGKKAPNFKAECTSEKTYARDDFNGKNLVLYFIQKIVLRDAQQKARISEIYMKNSRLIILRLLVYRENQ